MTSKKASNKPQSLEPLKLLFFSLICFLGIGLFFFNATFLPSTLISIVFYFIFQPLVDIFERKGISRTLSILGIFLVFGGTLALFTSVFYPKLTAELDSFHKGKALYSSQMDTRLRAQEKVLVETLPFLKPVGLVDKLMEWLNTSIEKIWSLAPNFASSIFICVFLVPLMTFLFLRDGNELRRNLLKLVPNRYFETTYTVLSRIVKELGSYVSARIIEASIVTILVSLACFLAGIPYAVLMGLFAGLTNPIPYLGPLIGFIPAGILALLDPQIPNQMFWSVIVFSAVNLFDMFVLFPLVVARIVKLHPLVVVLSVVLGSQLFGVIGMLVAVPVTSIIKIFLHEIYLRIYETPRAK